jgi:hypothetical protein
LECRIDRALELDVFDAHNSGNAVHEKRGLGHNGLEQNGQDVNDDERSTG